MRLSPRLAQAVLLAALAALPAMPAAAAVSAAVGKDLNAAAAAAKSGNTAAAISAAEAAKKAATTAEEKQKASQMAAYVYTRAGRYGQAAAELEASGSATPKQLAPLYYQAGQYDKAIAEARKAGGEDMQILIAQASLHQGKYNDAIAAYNNLIKTNGAKPIYLENLAAAQYKSGDKKGYLATTEKLVRADSSPARWKALLANFRQNEMRPEAKLALYHLMNTTGTIDRPVDWQEYAKLALVANQAGIATDALTKAGPPSDAMGERMVQAAGQLSTKAKTEAPTLAANPSTALRGANAYFGAGDYGKAIAAYDTAIKAGGVEADQARVFKGIAQVKSGQGNAAKATFASVSDANGMKDIANLWTLYASTHG